MLLMSSQKRLMNNLFRLFFDRFFISYSTIIKSLLSLCQPFCRFAGLRVFLLAGLRAKHFAVLRFCPQTGLQFCGLLVISLEVVVQCCPDDLIVFHLFFGGMQAYFFDQARLKSRCIFFWPLRGIAGGLACGFAVLRFCGFAGFF
jgi:hypothetical protein